MSLRLNSVHFISRFTAVVFKTDESLLRQLSTLTIVLTLEKLVATFSTVVSRSSLFLALVPLIIPGRAIQTELCSIYKL